MVQLPVALVGALADDGRVSLVECAADAILTRQSHMDGGMLLKEVLNDNNDDNNS